MKTEIIVKIKINDNTEVELTQEEAQELYCKLKDIFNKKEIFPIPAPVYPDYPVYPTYPIITWECKTKSNDVVKEITC